MPVPPGLGVQHQLPLRMEPGLFEWLVWYSDGLPSFLSPEELRSWGFNVDTSYRPLVSVQELRERTENCEQYYMRNHFVTQSVIRTTGEGPGGGGRGWGQGGDEGLGRELKIYGFRVDRIDGV